MHSFVKEERGSFTIEASLVFPGFLIFTLLCVFLCILVFQIGSANFVAQKAASEMAYTWDNSYKNVETGAFPKSAYGGLKKNGNDGLYWRVADSSIMDIFGLSGFGPGGSVRSKKLEKKSLFNTGGITVEADQKHRNLGLESEVKVTAESTLYIPTFLSNFFGSKVKAEASRSITETPELVRDVNFLKYFWTEFNMGKKIQKALDNLSLFPF